MAGACTDLAVCNVLLGDMPTGISKSVHACDGSMLFRLHSNSSTKLAIKQHHKKANANNYVQTHTCALHHHATLVIYPVSFKGCNCNLTWTCSAKDFLDQFELSPPFLHFWPDLDSTISRAKNQCKLNISNVHHYLRTAIRVQPDTHHYDDWLVDHLLIHDTDFEMLDIKVRLQDPVYEIVFAHHHLTFSHITHKLGAHD